MLLSLSLTFTFLIALLAPSVAMSQTEPASISELQKHMQSVNNLSVDFDHLRFSSLRKNKVESSGKAYFSKPNRFRWVVEDKEEWIYDGKTFKLYNPAMKELTLFPGQSNQAREMQNLIAMVLDTKNLFEQYTIEESKTEKDNLFLKLKPKRSGDVTDLNITLDQKSKFVSQVRINYQGGNYTEVKFTNPSYAKITDSTFEFKAPPGLTINELK